MGSGWEHRSNSGKDSSECPGRRPDPRLPTHQKSQAEDATKHPANDNDQPGVGGGRGTREGTGSPYKTPDPSFHRRSVKILMKREPRTDGR